MRGTVAAIERELMRDGFVQRYTQHPATAWTACRRARARSWPARSGWPHNYALMGRRDEAREMFERLLALRNDVGLLAEEYDTAARRLVGNFPQAFSHVPLIDTARNLAVGEGPTHPRAREGAMPAQESTKPDPCPRY